MKVFGAAGATGSRSYFGRSLTSHDLPYEIRIPYGPAAARPYNGQAPASVFPIPNAQCEIRDLFCPVFFQLIPGQLYPVTRPVRDDGLSLLDPERMGDVFLQAEPVAFQVRSVGHCG